MKKLTAMLLSLMMCFSLMAIPAHTPLLPDPEGPSIIDVGKTPIDPGDDDPDEPGIPVQPMADWPDPREDMPVDD